MTRVRIGTTVWETGAPRFLPLGRARTSMLAVWGRTAAVLAVTGPLALTTIVSTPKAGEAKDDVAAQFGAPKDEVRLEPWTSPSPTGPPDASRATSRLSPAHLFVAEMSGEATRFSPWNPAVEPGRFAPWNPVIAAPEWQEEEFVQVDIVDGRTLQAGPIRIQLIGLDLPMGEQVCRTLDGRFEPCATRAATQLELLTRHRNIICHYRLERAGEAIGRCRVGTSDLTERMVQTGYVWRSAALPAEGGH
jgi:endonuclease YncB( thermonuclease family)